MNYRIFISLLLLSSLHINAQTKNAFGFNERASYDVYYNWQFVWIKAGEVTFSTHKITMNNIDYFHFDSQGGTLENYEWIYRVDDRYQAIANTQSLLPIKASREIIEGKKQLVCQQVFDQQAQQLIATTNIINYPIKVDTLKMLVPCRDVLTAIYECRNLDFSKLSINQIIPLSVAIDNEIFSLHIRFLGYETILNRDEKKYATIKFSVLLIDGTIFSGGENMTVWVSNDANRIPIQVEANILVGSIRAFLSEIKGNLYPIKVVN